MKTRRWSRRRARALGSVALALGLAAGAGATSGAASAAVTGPARGCCRLLTESAAAAVGFNSNGQLGNGAGNIYLAVNTNWSAVIGLSSGVVQVSAGYSYALALTSDGSVWAWGSGGSGQLGDGSTTDSDVPVQVTGLTGIVQVSAGGSESVALRSDGTVWTWGDNASGELGDGTTNASSTPVPVTGLTGVTQISAGAGFVLAVRSDGTVWAWGANDYGQLGDGTTFDSSVPVQVTGLSRVTAIAAGSEDSMAVATKGYVNMLSAVYEWGANEHGQIGDGTYRERPVPVQINGIGTQHVSGIAAGLNFSVVLGTDGSVWDWGVNQIGQLGDGGTANAIVPVEVQGPGSGITQVCAGLYHMLAVRSDGTVLAWGDNFSGELGNGISDPTVPNPTPVQVVGLSGITQVTAGYLFTVAIHQVSFIQLPGVTKRPLAGGPLSGGAGGPPRRRI